MGKGVRKPMSSTDWLLLASMVAIAAVVLVAAVVIGAALFPPSRPLEVPPPTTTSTTTIATSGDYHPTAISRPSIICSGRQRVTVRSSNESFSGVVSKYVQLDRVLRTQTKDFDQLLGLMSDSNNVIVQQDLRAQTSYLVYPGEILYLLRWCSTLSE